MRAGVPDWLNHRRKAVLLHGLVIAAFLCFCVFVSEPIFDRFITIAGEAGLQSISLPAETGGIRCGIDGLDVGVHITELRGWAFIDGCGPNDAQTFIVLKSGGTCHVFDTQVELRPDVTSAYGDSNLGLDRSGFVCNVPSRKIGNGPYVIGIYIRNANTEALTYTDFVVTKD
jgi:hypothetical protein